MALLNGKTMEQVAVERLKTFEGNATDKDPDGYYLAYSGGKDSDVILHLARKAGVKFTAHHHLTTCDPPEVVYHVRTQPDVQIDKPKETMWQLIRRKKMPPRRNARYCCEALKEGGGQNRLVITGIRWGESARRSKRKMVESCYRQRGKMFLNVICDWTTKDVWDYIKAEGVNYCGLYDEGFDRLGCVLCPMRRDVEKQIQRWPKIAAAWERAIKATFNPSGVGGRVQFDSAEAYWQWWLDRDRSARVKDVDGQEVMMFEDQ